MNKESLSFSRVQNNNLWFCIWLNSEYFSKIIFTGSIQPAEIKADSARNFACISLTYTVENIELWFINILVSINKNNAKCSIFFQTNIVSTIWRNLWNIDNHPWLWCTRSFYLIIFWCWVNENLTVNIDEFKNAFVGEFLSIKSNWFSFRFNNNQRWEFLYLIFLCNCFFAFSDKTELKCFLKNKNIWIRNNKNRTYLKMMT